MDKNLKTNRIHVLVSDAEKAAMQAAADALGLTLSAWVRMTLLKAAKEKK